MNQQVRFKEIRKRFGYTQIELGELTNTSTETISMIERGKVKTINDNILKFFDSKGVNNSWLKFGTGEMFKSESSDDSDWKEKAMQAEAKIGKLEQKIIDLQAKMNRIYAYLIENSDKLDLSELNLGKHEVCIISELGRTDELLMAS